MSPASEEHPQRSLGVSSTARRPGPSPVISSASTSRRSSFYKSVKGVFSRADSGYGSSKSTTTTSSSLAFPPLPTSSPSPAAGAAQLRTLFAALSAAPPSPHGNGLTASESAAPSDPTPKDSLFHSVWAQIKAGTFGEGVEVALDALTGVLKGKGELDDREMFLEELIGFLGKLPEDSPIRQPITDKLLQLLWADLPHGNYAHVGDKNWRSADGSNGSEVPVDGKGVGAAGSLYARTVPPCHPKSPSLPDPTVIFDALLRRPSSPTLFKPHPSGISSLLFSFATIIIHSAFQTSREDANVNEASSYLDLSPLYGNGEEEMRTVRSYEQGRLWPDVVASSRLFLMPPSVVALLVIFSRNHNFIVDKLFKINEKGAYKPWDSLDASGKAAQDEALFQQGRLINCGWFLNVIVQDYIRTILNLNRTESFWSLSPSTASKDFISGHTARGVGNCVSVEFNLIYRWHSAISRKDEQWIEGLFKDVLGADKDLDTLTNTDFALALRTLNARQGPDPRTWKLDGLSRTADGSFADADLCKILSDATDEVAGAFGANGSPGVMKLIDVMGMVTARTKWNVCSMNEFRSFLNLKPFSTFEEWNPDPIVSSRAEHLYGHIDNLELFPGLHAEAAKPSREGSGLATNYTISRAILSDAVALVRGDRFSCGDLNVATCSSWGYQDLQPDNAGGSYGGVLGRLLMRNLPNSYRYNSTYALFPFSTPSTTRKILASFSSDVLSRYDSSRPAVETPPIHGVYSYKACMDVLADLRRFGTVYDEAIKNCSTPYGYFIAQEGEAHRTNRMVQAKALFPTGWQEDLRKFYMGKTAQLIEAKAMSYDGGKTFTVDVVRDVTNLTAVYWCARQFGIPLKTTSSPHGLFTPQELYLILSAFFISVFMGFSLADNFKLRNAAKSAAPALLGVLRLRISQVKGVPARLEHLARHVQDVLVGKNVEGIVQGETSRAYYTRLLANAGGRSTEELESSVQSTMTASVSNQGQVAAQVINFFLEDTNRVHKDNLVALCKLDTPEADVKILSLVNEAMRLDPQVPLIPRVALEDTTIVDGDKTIEVKRGEGVYPSMKAAGIDPSVFPNPEQVMDRDPKLYRLFGHGAHTCLGAPIVEISMVAMIKEIFRLPNVRRAPGGAGKLARFSQNVGGTECNTYLSANATIWPLPVSMSIVYDAE